MDFYSTLKSKQKKKVIRNEYWKHMAGILVIGNATLPLRAVYSLILLYFLIKKSDRAA